MTAIDPHGLSRGPTVVTASGTHQPPAQAGRSTLLRAGVRPPSRGRWFVRRALVVALLIAAVVLVVVAVGTVWFRPDGPARVLYQIHDLVWLPLRGWFWVAPFPGGLMWLVPAAGLILLVLIEYLGVAAPLRTAQTAGIRMALRGRAGPALVLWDGVLRGVGLRAGQVRRVAIEMRDASRSAVITAIEMGAGTGPVAALVHQETVVLRLSDGDDRDLMSAVETLCLARLGKSPMGDVLAQTIVQKSGSEASKWRAWALACQTGTLDLHAALAAAGALVRNGGDAATLAVTTMQVALGVTTLGQPGFMAWFDAWARLRAGSDQAGLAALVQAETMIAFEFWAAQAEGSIQRPGTENLLAEAFETHFGLRDRGEVFARTGRGALQQRRRA